METALMLSRSSSKPRENSTMAIHTAVRAVVERVIVIFTSVECVRTVSRGLKAVVARFERVAVSTLESNHSFGVDEYLP